MSQTMTTAPCRDSCHDIYCFDDSDHWCHSRNNRECAENQASLARARAENARCAAEAAQRKADRQARRQANPGLIRRAWRFITAPR